MNRVQLTEIFQDLLHNSMFKHFQEHIHLPGINSLRKDEIIWKISNTITVLSTITDKNIHVVQDIPKDD